VGRRRAGQADATGCEKWISPQEYLELDRSAAYKSEYYNGEMFAMAGGTPPHNLVAAHLIREMGNRLRGGSCRVFSSDQRVRVIETGLGTYADVTIVCGEPAFEDDDRDTIVNPTYLIEVLSPRTEAFDRGLKAEYYHKIPSLRGHALIAQDRPNVEVCYRGGEQWYVLDVTGLEAAVKFPGLETSVPMSEIYLGVDFPEKPYVGLGS